MSDSGVVTLKEYWFRLFGEQMYEEWTISHNANIQMFIDTPMTKLSFEMLHAIGACDMIYNKFDPRVRRLILYALRAQLEALYFG